MSETDPVTDVDAAYVAMRYELDVRFNDHTRRFAHLDPDDADLWSDLHGVTPARYSAIVRRVRQETVDHAIALITDTEFLEALRRLRSGSDRLAVALGDSITADRGSWLSILSVAGSLTGRPMSWINAGVSGDTTTHGLARFDLGVASYRPETVVILLGTNDARRSRLVPGPPLISPATTQENLRRLVEFARSAARTVVLVTPPPIDPALLDVWQFELDATWRAEDLDTVADAVRRVAAETGSILVDLWPDFGAAPEQLHLPDGLHPSAAGQRAIARRLVLTLDAAQMAAQGSDRSVSPTSLGP